jgi:hypothetical protein
MYEQEKAEHEHAGGWSYIPTMNGPHGAVEVQVSEETGQILVIGHSNKTVSAWATDMTLEQAQWLADGLHRAVAVAQVLAQRRGQ